jgi:hypothetical protein
MSTNGKTAIERSSRSAGAAAPSTSFGEDDSGAGELPHQPAADTEQQASSSNSVPDTRCAPRSPW